MQLHDLFVNSLREDEQARNGLRVSDIGLCPTQVYYSIVDPELVEKALDRAKTKEEIDKEEQKLVTMFTGSAVHDRFENILKQQGAVVASELAIYDDELGISGHLDILADLGNDDYLDLIEVKTMNSFGLIYVIDKEKKAKEHHEMQALLYKDMVKKIYRKKIRPSIVYFGKDSGVFKQFFIEDEAKKLKKAKLFFSDLNTAIMLRKPPVPEDVIFNPFKQEYEINWKSTYCPIHNICAGDGWEYEARQKVREENAKLKSK